VGRDASPGSAGLMKGFVLADSANPVLLCLLSASIFWPHEPNRNGSVDSMDLHELRLGQGRAGAKVVIAGNLRADWRDCPCPGMAKVG
jgi:hypothetical protein